MSVNHSYTQATVRISIECGGAADQRSIHTVTGRRVAANGRVVVAAVQHCWSEDSQGNRRDWRAPSHGR